MDSREAQFDPKTARFALDGNNQISFADPSVSGRFIPVISSRGRSGVSEGVSRVAWAARGGGGWRRC